MRRGWIGRCPSSALCGQVLSGVRERLVEAQCFDVTVELAQRVEPFRGTPAGVTHEIIKPIFACDDYKVCDAIGQPNPHDHGIAVGEIRIDQLIRRQVFVDMSKTAWRQPHRAVPIKPAAVGISINGCEKPVQPLRIGLDTIELEYHRCRCDGAALAAKRTVVRNTTERIVAPSFVGLAEGWHSQLNAMKEVTSPARRKWSFPIPVDVQTGTGGD